LPEKLDAPSGLGEFRAKVESVLKVNDLSSFIPLCTPPNNSLQIVSGRVARRGLAKCGIMRRMFGVVLAALAACAWGASAIFVRMGTQRLNVTMGTLISLMAGLFFSLSVALLVARDALFSVSLVALAWFALIGILQFPMGRFFNYQAVSRLGVGRSIPLVSTAPLFAVAIAIIFTGERVTPFLIVGALTIFGGIYLIVTAGQQR